MKIYREQSLKDFEWWIGAKNTAKRIDEEVGEEGWEKLEEILEEIYPEGIDETQLNDILWFEPETIYEWLGIRNEDEEEEKYNKSPMKDVEELYDEIYADLK